ncbi:helix-turn-helix domain-containing protein [Pricia sp. S334]|uniref:Helix-turn-helix domain-containing protein n=1 Tax=Pricia mediterranea TaxID=3076079 RepID=A0ABU3L2H2_9FLAO|nr:helix-turn-helix domain-containing protein [Pricia sp. S334]MDT7827793.1 helix-turn-helix domain-containing protein [Pricia sp. S334]
MVQFRMHYNPTEVCRLLVTEHLNVLGISFSFDGSGELTVHSALSERQLLMVAEALKTYGITLSDKEDGNIVKAVKHAIETLIKTPDMRTEKISVYLSEKLGYSYSYLSNRFSEETHSSIENFIILRRIEYAKRLMLEDGMSLTEVARRLDYSSVAHLSGQFKKITGLTPTAFLRIIEKRNKVRTT